MRSVAEHLAACRETISALPPLEVYLTDAVGCILAEAITAPFDLPVTDLAGCDGYAVNAQATEGASAQEPRELRVLEEINAGDTEHCAITDSASARISSGAPLPAGANAVVPYEETDGGQTKVAIYSETPVGQNVKPRAVDAHMGQNLLEAGERIGPRQVALLAAVGRSRVTVRPRPRVVVISIGNELVEPGNPARPGQVFDANSHALAIAATDAGAGAIRVSCVPDSHRQLRNTIEDQLVRADILITTGGLSYGSHDTVKEVLSPLGTVRFDNVAITPGRQLGVGTIQGTPVFCLPGDPVAVQAAYETFVRPCLLEMAGYSGASIYRSSVKAAIQSSWVSPAGRREFLPVKLTGNHADGYRAEITGQPGLTLVTALAAANAFAVIPETETEVSAGTPLHCMIL